MSRSHRIAVTAALVTGAAWTAKFLVILGADGEVHPLTDVLWLSGLIGLIVAGSAAGVAYRGRLGGVAGFLLTGIAFALVQTVGDALAHAVYSGTNPALHGEVGVLLAALICAAAGLRLGGQGRQGAVQQLA